VPGVLISSAQAARIHIQPADWVADGLEPEFSGGLKGLNAIARYDCCFGSVSI
jgi:hypothetical protein